jgi:hypothetical protein
VPRCCLLARRLSVGLPGVDRLVRSCAAPPRPAFLLVASLGPGHRSPARLIARRCRSLNSVLGSRDSPIAGSIGEKSFSVPAIGERSEAKTRTLGRSDRLALVSSRMVSSSVDRSVARRRTWQVGGRRGRVGRVGGRRGRVGRIGGRRGWVAREGAQVARWPARCVEDGGYGATAGFGSET